MSSKTADPFTLSTGDLARLMTLVEALAKVEGLQASAAIDRLEMLASGKSLSGPRGDLPNFVERLRNIRMRRNAVVGAPLFRDPAWDMMLALYSAHQQGRKESITSLCYASGVPTTTALRQLSRLETHGMITREGDRSDLRRCWIVPTQKALDGIGTMATLMAEEGLASPFTDEAPSSAPGLVPPE